MSEGNEEKREGERKCDGGYERWKRKRDRKRKRGEREKGEKEIGEKRETRERAKRQEIERERKCLQADLSAWGPHLAGMGTQNA